MTNLDPELIEILRVQFVDAIYMNPESAPDSDVKVSFWATQSEPLPTYLEYVRVVGGHLELTTVDGRLEKLQRECPAVFGFLESYVIEEIDRSNG